MPEQNIQNQPGPKRNPTRENTKVSPINKDEENEKSFESGEPQELDQQEVDLDRYGVSSPKDDPSLELSGDEDASGERGPKTTPPEESETQRRH